MGESRYFDQLVEILDRRVEKRRDVPLTRRRLVTSYLSINQHFMGLLGAPAILARTLKYG
jgi:hypothetical protein